MTAEAPTTMQHRAMANALRFLAADAVERAGSGHPGMPMGMADVATVLFTRFLKFDSAAPRWPDRDRFILSAGHGSMLLYGLAYLTGYADVDLEQIKNFRQLGSRTAGHPEFGHVAIAETTTGPLAQGLANAVGFALAEKMRASRFGDDLVDHDTYVIAGDGCLMEGLSQEALSLAGHHRLSKLIILWDDNEISIDGAISKASSDDQLARFAASGWHTAQIDGHDPEQIAAAIAEARAADAPSLIACQTIIGFGAPTKEGSEKTHGTPLGEEELAGARENLEWPHPPFEVPVEVLEAWRAAGHRGESQRQAWEARHAAADSALRGEFDRMQSGRLPGGWQSLAQTFKDAVIEQRPNWSGRRASQESLELLTMVIPDLIGGSADLTHSNFTMTRATRPVTPEDAGGRYIHYGVREHAMAAAMNGLALHGGFIPYGGTFLVFADYLRPALRMSAIMGQQVIYVLTHDSIGVGEDGPTHQPIEHLASLRAMPNVLVVRPCDPVETMEAYEIALTHRSGPTVLALSRQNMATKRTTATENLTAKGAYVLLDADGPRRVTLIATGSEVDIAVAAQSLLAAQGIAAAVVSMPCWSLFAGQDRAYRDSVLGIAGLRVAIEAAASFGWERWIGTDGIMIGMSGYGASCPPGQVYAHFGITAQAVVDKVLENLSGES